MPHPKHILALVVLALVAAFPASAVTITIVSGYGNDNNHTLGVAAYDSTPGQVGEVYHLIPTPPDVGTLAQSQGRASASLEYSITQYGTGALFNFDSLFDISGASSPYGPYAITEGTIYFSVDEDTTYSLSGAIDGGGQGIHLYLDALLYKIPYNGFSFYQYGVQYQDYTHMELGQQPYDFNSGSLTGILEANQLYLFNFSESIANRYNTADAGSASGNISFLVGAQFEQGAPDAPATLGLLLMSGSLLVLGRRWQSRRQRF